MQYLSSLALAAVSFLCPLMFGQGRPAQDAREEPRAHAGKNRIAGVGSTVILDGSASTDPKGRSLTYKWSLVRRPEGSTAVLSNPDIANPAFTLDVSGLYLAELIVSNGETTSTSSTVAISTARPRLAPYEFSGEPSAPFVNPGSRVLLNLGMHPLAAGTGNPQPVSVSPALGNTSSQTFTFVFSDSTGWQNVQPDVIINRFLDGRQACYVVLRPDDASHWSVMLVVDAGDAAGTRFDLPIDGTPGSGTAQNSQCTINGSGSSMMGKGNTLTVNLAITFNASFGGNKQIIMAAADAVSNANSGWQPLGVVGALPLPANGPQAVGVNPGRSTGSGQIYTFTFTDTKGWQDIGIVDTLTNSFVDGRQACYIAFLPSSATKGTVYLVDDAGDAGTNLMQFYLGTGAAVSNSQCTVKDAGSSLNANGNSFVLTLNISFNNSFAGNRIFFLAARNDNAHENSDWQAAGTVTVVSVPRLAFSPGGNLQIVPGAQFLSLTSPAQGTPLTVSLSSSNTGAVTAPASITIPANAGSVTVPVTAVGTGNSTITASAPGLPDAAVNLFVCICFKATVSPGLVSVGAGMGQVVTITLNSVPVQPPGTGTGVVTLTSGNPSVFLVAAPGAVTGNPTVTLPLPPGVLSTQAVIMGVSPGTAIVTASAATLTTGYAIGTATVTVTQIPTVNSAQPDAGNKLTQVEPPP